jgi:hypothetical protein
MHVIATNVGAVLADIHWDPEIRNILALSVGIAILVGSVALLVSTNTGPRTGLLVTLACLFGWLMLMGLTWWMYGIGMKGEASHWRVVEINRGDLAAAQNPTAAKLPDLDEEALVDQILAKHPELETAVNPEHKADKVPTIGELVEANPNIKAEFGLQPDSLGGWNILVPSDKQRGDAQAAADAALGPDGQKIFKAASDYKVLEAYDSGGKNNEFRLPSDNACDIRFRDPDVSGCLNRVWNKIEKTIHITHPEHFAIVQVQAVVPQTTAPGQAPPTPKLDANAPVYSVIMIRSLGDLRFPGFMMFFIGAVLFTVTCWTLHRRDKLIDRNRAGAS